MSGVHTVADASGARLLCQGLLERWDDPLQASQRANVSRLFGEPGSARRITVTLPAMIAEETEAQVSGAR